MRIHEDDDARDEDRDHELEGEPSLPDRELLEAWTVPEPASDLADRVMQHVEGRLSASDASEEGAMSMQERRGGFGWALIGVAMVAAAALVLGLTQLWRSEPRVTAPVVVTVPVAVPVASPPATAPGPTPSEPPPPSPTPSEPSDAVAADAPPSAPAPQTDLMDPLQAEPASGEPDAAPSPKPSKKARRASRNPATLRIGTRRGYGPAKVYIDGKHMGMTPLMNVKVAPGRHTVRFDWSDGESETSSFSVDDGKTLTLKGPLEDSAEP